MAELAVLNKTETREKIKHFCVFLMNFGVYDIVVLIIKC